MLFNVYYMNFSKVYEIKMMLSNIIKTDGAIENLQGKTRDADIHAKMGTKFLSIFNSEVGGDIKNGATESQKVLENFKVTTTKSLILSEVIEQCTHVNSFEKELTEGQLIRIDNVTLSLENETELRTVKMFSNGIFKGMRLQEAGGLDVNNLINALFKDYSYKLKGETLGTEEKILLKVPVTFENEFESLYCVDDLFIGKVSVIGVYKGKAKIDKLKSSFEFFQELGQTGTDYFDSEIHNSQYEQVSSTKLKSEDEDVEYHYIDLLAIVQVIQHSEKKETTKKRKTKKETK